jgi:hypothetical protein
VIDGFASLPGSLKISLWIILIPQLFVAVISIAGLAGGAATALTLILPGSINIWMIASLLLATALVLWGKYKGVEKASVILASALALASIIAAITVAPSLNDMAEGMKFSIPEGTEIGEILPWLGFMMSGAAGLMWYSFWIPAKKYGMAGAQNKKNDQALNRDEIRNLPASEKKKLRGWIKMMSLDTTTAVIGTVIITVSFLILGTELLKPRGLVPEELEYL